MQLTEVKELANGRAKLKTQSLGSSLVFHLPLHAIHRYYRHTHCAIGTHRELDLLITLPVCPPCASIRSPGLK